MVPEVSTVIPKPPSYSEVVKEKRTENNFPPYPPPNYEQTSNNNLTESNSCSA